MKIVLYMNMIQTFIQNLKAMKRIFDAFN